MNTKMENESRQSLEVTGVSGNGRNAGTKQLNKKENKNNKFERSRTYSPKIKTRENLRSTVNSRLKHSMRLAVEENACDEVLKNHLTKTTSLPKHRTPETHNSAYTKIKSNETIMDKRALPVEKLAFSDEKLAYHKPSNNSVSLTRQVPPSHKNRTFSPKIKLEREWEPFKKDIFSSKNASEQPKLMPMCDGESTVIKLTSLSCQRQLPILFTLMSEQKSHSFRPSVKRVEKAIIKKEDGVIVTTRFSKRTIYKKESFALRAQSFTGRRQRSSSLPTASDTLRKFPMLFSRSDFETLYFKRLEEMWNKRPSTASRSSLQSDPDESVYLKSSKKGKIASVASSNLVDTNSMLSTSLPDARMFTRVRSAKTRRIPFVKHRRDSSKAPLIIEETDEVLQR